MRTNATKETAKTESTPKTTGKEPKMTEDERLSTLERLKLLRERSGLTYAKLAEKSNVPETTIQRIFGGRTPSPQMNTIRDLIRAMGGRLSDVFPEEQVFPEALRADLDPESDRTTYIDEKKISKAQAIKVLYEDASPAIELIKAYCLMIPEDDLITRVIPFVHNLSKAAKNEADQKKDL